LVNHLKFFKHGFTETESLYQILRLKNTNDRGCPK
jgi:hypothetical protein